MNLSDIILLLHPNADRLKGIVVQDDGQGLYVAQWDEDLYGVQPSDAELLAMADSLQAQYDNKSVIEKRIKEYGPLGAQLDMLYWDQVNGTTKFKDHITQVKADNPKV